MRGNRLLGGNISSAGIEASDMAQLVSKFSIDELYVQLIDFLLSITLLLGFDYLPAFFREACFLGSIF